MLKIFSQPRKVILSIFIYFLGISLIFLWGEYYFEYFVGYGLSLLGFCYFAYYLSNNNVNNKYLTNIFFISLLFFALRCPFIFKSSIYVDFDFYYLRAIFFLLGKIPLIYFTSSYGPVFYFLLFIPTILTNGDYYAIKFFFIFLDFLILILLNLIISQLKYKNRYKVLLLYTLMPFLIVEFSWNAHNDTGVVLLVLVSFYFLLKDQKILSSCFLLLAVAYKYYPIFIFPLYLIYIYKKTKKTDNEMNILNRKFIYQLTLFCSPIIFFGGIILLINPGLIRSYLAGVFIQGSRLPIYSFMESLYHLLYGTDLPTISGKLIGPEIYIYGEIIRNIRSYFPFFPYIYPNSMLQWDIPFVRYELSNFMLFIPILLGVFFIMWDKIRSKIHKIILSLAISSTIISYLILPTIPQILWFSISIFIIIILLSYNWKNKPVSSLIITIGILYLVKIFLPSTKYYQIFNMVFFYLSFVLIIANYYIFLKLKENKEELLIFSIFCVILSFILFYWVIYSWYFLWVVPFALIFFNKDRISSFFVVFIPIYVFLNNPTNNILLFKSFTNIFTIFTSNNLIQLILIAILIPINARISINVFESKDLKIQINKIHQIIIFTIWILMGIFSILFVNRLMSINSLELVKMLTQNFIFFNTVDFSVFWSFSSISEMFSVKLSYIIILDLILVTPIIYYILKKYLTRYLEVNGSIMNSDSYKYYFPLIVLILMVFFVNSIPLAVSSIFLAPVNIISIMTLLIFYKKIEKHKDLKKFISRTEESETTN